MFYFYILLNGIEKEKEIKGSEMTKEADDMKKLLGRDPQPVLRYIIAEANGLAKGVTLLEYAIKRGAFIEVAASHLLSLTKERGNYGDSKLIVEIFKKGAMLHHEVWYTSNALEESKKRGKDIISLAHEIGEGRRYSVYKTDSNSFIKEYKRTKEEMDRFMSRLMVDHAFNMNRINKDPEISQETKDNLNRSTKAAKELLKKRNEKND